MITPRTLNLRVDRRKQVLIQFRVKGLNLTTATFRSSVRAYPEAADAALINLPKVTNTDNGMKFVSVETVDGVPISTIQMQISAATMASGAIPPAGKAGTAGDPVIAWVGNWDLNITPADGIEAVYVRGAFIVEGVVTHD